MSPHGPVPLSAAVLIPAVFELGVLGLCLTGGSASRRRGHFWLRVLLVVLTVPALMSALVGVGRLGILPEKVAALVLAVVFLLSVTGLMAVPALLYHGGGPNDSDGGDGGGGPGPGESPPTPGGGSGGVPLLDGVQAAARRRDHNRPSFALVRTRRPAHDPSPAAPSRR